MSVNSSEVLSKRLHKSRSLFLVLKSPSTDALVELQLISCYEDFSWDYVSLVEITDSDLIIRFSLKTSTLLRKYF